MKSWPTKAIAEVERIKAAGRGRESKSEWWAALGEYEKAIKLLSRIGMPAPHLHNHAGDLYLKVDLEREAVKHYHRAIDLYLEEGQAKSAIALCRKVLRRLPDEIRMTLRIGEIRAAEGFYLEAREDLLNYASMAQLPNDVHAGLDALVTLAKATPRDVQLRFELSDRLMAVGRLHEAMELLRDEAIGGEEGLPDAMREAVTRQAKEIQALMTAPPMPPANLPPARIRRPDMGVPPIPAAPWTSHPTAGIA